MEVLRDIFVVLFPHFDGERNPRYCKHIAFIVVLKMAIELLPTSADELYHLFDV